MFLLPVEPPTILVPPGNVTVRKPSNAPHHLVERVDSRSKEQNCRQHERSSGSHDSLGLTSPSHICGLT